jgi:3-hydroxyisobutyrate dehydrogenase
MNSAVSELGVGVVGLGLVGGGVCRRLHAAGLTADGYDVRAEAVAELDGVVRPADSVRELAQAADVVLIAVMNDEQLRNVLFGSTGVLAAARPPRAVVVLTTTTVATVRHAAGECEARAVALLDCGVSGGAGGLERGAMVAMVGGAPDEVELVRPILATFADPVVHMGPVGMGMAAKLARNVIVYADWFVAWEASRLAIEAGVDLEAFVQVVEASDRWVGSHMFMAKQGIGLRAADDGSPISSPAVHGYASKDLAAALEFAVELGIEMPGARLAAQQFDAVAGVRGPAGA